MSTQCKEHDKLYHISALKVKRFSHITQKWRLNYMYCRATEPFRKAGIKTLNRFGKIDMPTTPMVIQMLMK